MLYESLGFEEADTVCVGSVRELITSGHIDDLY